MKSTFKILTAATILSLAVSSLVSAKDKWPFSNSGSFRLAYAELAGIDKSNNAFGEFIFDDSEHELNDAWLGMPVKAKDGRLVGFVADAYLDDDGEITELLVELNAGSLNYSVYVEASFASLTDMDVKTSLSANQIASLKRENNTLLSSR